MKEDFLHAVWKFKAFSFQSLFTDNGCQLNIINFGTHNYNAGPDFLNATIKINETTWHGHIEIHVSASDWFKHKHQNDPFYKSVILHVVYNNDLEVDKLNIPTLTLINRIRPSFYKKYNSLLESSSKIPCHNLISTINTDKIPLLLESYLIEKLEHRSRVIKKTLETTGMDWSETLYRATMSAFGLTVNRYAFELLSKSISYKTLLKHNSHFQMEALLFGASGLLEDKTDDYCHSLIKEYHYLKKKLKIKKCHIIWKYSKMHPMGFPDLLIALAVSFFINNKNIFNTLLSVKAVKDLDFLFDHNASKYWLNHYRLNKLSKKKTKKMGPTRKKIILINALIPIVYTYGKITQQELYCQKALEWISDFPAENNKLIRSWKALRIKVNNAAESQALIYLQKNYCKNFKCLNCKIGHQVIFN